MRRLLFVLGWLMCTMPAFAQQDSTAYFNNNGKGIGYFLERRILYPKQYTFSCARPFTYIKFKVGKDNKVSDVSYSNNDVYLKTVLDKALLATNGYWVTKKLKNKWLIIPVFFYWMQYPEKTGCDMQKEVDELTRQVGYKYPEGPDYIYLAPLSILAGGSGVIKY